MQIHLRITNRQMKQVEFIMEPLGEVHLMNPQETFLVVFVSNLPGEPEVEITETSIIIYGWTESVSREDGTIVSG